MKMTRFYLTCVRCQEAVMTRNYSDKGLYSDGEVVQQQVATLQAQLEAVRRERDDALRQAKAEGMAQVTELRKAMELYREASYQGHSAHWDKTGGSGSGCPACLRATELRAQARQIVDALDARAAQIEEGRE